MSFWGNIRERTKLGFQYLKEKAGLTEIEVDAEYQAAVERFTVLKTRIRQFFQDFQVLVSLIPKVTSSGVDFSVSLIQATQDIYDDDMTLPRAFERFHLATKSLVEDDLIPMCELSVIEEVASLNEQFKNLSKLKSERRRIQLLSDSTRDRLNSLVGKGSPEEIASLRIQHEGQLQELAAKTDLFKKQVNDFWELRFTVIELPLERFVGLIFSICEKTFHNMKELQKVIDPELLEKDFVPTKGK